MFKQHKANNMLNSEDKEANGCFWSVLVLVVFIIGLSVWIAASTGGLW